MFVRLVLAGGMKAGMVAEIKEGFYLIGRDKECQIRPDSDSVSERHCLLQHEGKHFRVFVLDDDSPTQVNHKPLPAKKWRTLNHGDMLQVGRVPFMVAITAKDPSVPASGKASSDQLPSTSKPKTKSTAKLKTPEINFAERDTKEIDVDGVTGDSSENRPQSKPPRWKTP